MNFVTILGRISTDIGLSYTQNNSLAICNFNIAYNKRLKDGTDKASFFKCVAFGRGAELIQQGFKKGDRILIEGELSQDSYEWQGQKRSEFKIIVSRAYMIDFKSQSQPQSQSQPRARAMADIEIDDDEIPF